MAGVDEISTIECGVEARKHFAFDSKYTNLNHGSFGTYPTEVRTVFRHYQEASEAKPDAFIRFEYKRLLDNVREVICKYLNAPESTVVFIPNATTGMNLVLRNLVWEPNDVIIYFATIYGACEKTLSYLEETTPVRGHKIAYTYPVSDEQLLHAFEQAVSEVKAAGKNPRLAVFDTIASLPGIRVPFEALTALCKKHGLLSCIDGAHGIGHIPLDLTALDADFFFSNCHKWLHVPRGCAVFYVPERNQPLMRSTLPTSHGFVPLPVEGQTPIFSPLPVSAKREFINNFDYYGTIDTSPFLCVPAALQWRSKLTWDGRRGEGAVMSYTANLAQEAGKLVASRLGTDMLHGSEHSLARCNMTNVRLPLSFAAIAGSDRARAGQIGLWMLQTLAEEYNTAVAIFFYADSWWARLSAQVYLTLADFEAGVETLGQICTRLQNGDGPALKQARL